MRMLEAAGSPGPTPSGRPEGTSSDAWRVVVVTTSGADGAYGFLDGLLRSLGHRIVGVLTTPGPPTLRSSDYLGVVAAAAPDVDVIVSTNRQRWAAQLAPLEPDLLICAAFPYRLPDDVLELPRLGAINGHSSLLPKYRGPNPQGWVLRNGDTETGFTIHRMARDFDSGPILSQVRLDVTDDDDVASLGARIARLLPDAFIEALTRIGNGELGEPQDADAGSTAPLFDEEWQHIDWTRSARQVHNQVRSLFELPGRPAGAIALVEGRKIRILRTRLVAAEPGEASPAAPGTVVATGDARRAAGAAGVELPPEQQVFAVQCGDAPVEIVEWTDG